MTQNDPNLWDSIFSAPEPSEANSPEPVSTETETLPPTVSKPPAVQIPHPASPKRRVSPAAWIALGVVLGILLTMLFTPLFQPSDPDADPTNPETDTVSPEAGPVELKLIEKCRQAVADFQQSNYYAVTCTNRFYGYTASSPAYGTYYKHNDNWQYLNSSKAAAACFMKHSGIYYQATTGGEGTLFWMHSDLPADTTDADYFPWLAAFPWQRYSFTLKSDPADQNQISLEATLNPPGTAEDLDRELLLTFFFDDTNALTQVQRATLHIPLGDAGATMDISVIEIDPASEEEIKTLLDDAAAKAEERYSKS